MVWDGAGLNMLLSALLHLSRVRPNGEGTHPIAFRDDFGPTESLGFLGNGNRGTAADRDVNHARVLHASDRAGGRGRRLTRCCLGHNNGSKGL